ncbi:MAG: Amuc_1100 family pilus-like protein [Opitutales bacterium]|nr:Amuc_1100 family pilus-like protein [Opitutales bacterium]
MEIVRQHPVFSLIIGLLLLGGIGQGVWGWLIQRERASLERTYMQEHRSLAALVASMPPPTLENVRAVEGEIARLRDLQAAAADSLAASGAVLDLPPAPSAEALFFEIVAFVERVEGRARSADIVLGDALGFGFRDIVDAGQLGRAGTTAEGVRTLQRQLSNVEHLTDHLLAARPERIVSVARESAAGEGGAEVFRVDPLVSAAREGAIRTEGYRFVFEGRTSSLRDFLAAIGLFERPLVVRDVSVQTLAPPTRAEAGRTRSERARPAATGGEARRSGPTAADIFGLPATTTAPAESLAEPTAVPIIESNRSRFTVTVEYFELLGGGEPT